MYSKVHYPACAPLFFFITFCSRCGMEWAKSYSVESGIFFKACLSRLFRSFMVSGVGSLWTTSCIMLQRLSTGLISGEFGGSIKFGRFLLHHARVLRPVLDESHVLIGTEQFSFVYCFIHFFPAKGRFHFFL